MKLRNKKNGEIGLLNYTSSDGNIIIQDINAKDNCEYIARYNSLAELNAEWEDYEEPKVYYYISDFGAIRECEIGRFPEDEEDRKQIGNYFETEEEAEKAVEKIEAWERLKDKGFRFIHEASHVEELEETGGNVMFIACTMNDYRDFVFGDNADIKLLFGGEE